MDFSEVYERYVHDVQRFAFFLSGNSALAEDLTAETFVHAFCGPSDLRVDTVKAYLFAIARNLYRDEMARRRRLVQIDEVPERVDTAPSQDQAAADRQRLSSVLRAIQRLPEPQREALVLAVDQDLRYEQIAAILDCSVVAVKVRIHRARLQLKSELEAEEKIWKT
jgi:RNA polymerase sigma-70 factor (ECF subfamily)